MATGTIRAWTIQPGNVWDEVTSGRAVTVDWRFSASLHVGYDWLREQLIQRLPGYTGHYPWWAYGSRPDLRQHRHQQPLGMPFDLLELCLPPTRAVVIPFWAWDLIFSVRYVNVDRRVAADWER